MYTTIVWRNFLLGYQMQPVPLLKFERPNASLEAPRKARQRFTRSPSKTMLDFFIAGFFISVTVAPQWFNSSIAAHGHLQKSAVSIDIAIRVNRWYTTEMCIENS